MYSLLPPPGRFLRALDIYLKHAFKEQLPLRVRSQQEILRTWGGDFWKAPLFVCDNVDAPTRLSVRLGNDFYPHMKLVLELDPSKQGMIFRVDTHDRHCCPPPNSPEYEAFLALMGKNQRLAEEIESAWENDGLHTFKSYLREDLKRRHAGGN